MNTETWLQDNLNELRGQHLERSIRTFSAPSTINLSTNDYLNLSNHPHVMAMAEKALRDYGAGSKASRLVTGSLPIHDELERRIAAHKGYPAALLFGSGYMTNAGVIPALVGRDDHVFADRLAHASILDAATLSRARLHRFQHNDASHLDSLLQKTTGRKLVVTESVFSMDGDLAPLKEIASAADRSDAMLMVDEAHATGVFGPRGRGLVAAHNLQAHVNISMITLSKAIGGYGGAVACSKTMRQWLVNKARALIYTTAPPPAVIGAAIGALEILDREPDRGATLLKRADRLRQRLTDAGFDTMNSRSQIIPLLIGDNARTLALAERLRERGVLAIAIRPPTVPAGTARLRLSVTLAHSESDLEKSAEAIIAEAKAGGIL